MDIDRIRQLIALVGSAAIRTLEIEEAGTRIVITAGDALLPPPASRPGLAPDPRPGPMSMPGPGPGPGPGPTPVSAGPSNADSASIASPAHGIVHLSPAPGVPPYVVQGQPVETGTQVALVEAMKVFTAVKASQPGHVAAILVTDGAEVETGMPLFRLS